MFSFSTPRLFIRPLTEHDKALYCQLYTDKQVMQKIAPPLSEVKAEQAFTLTLKLTQKIGSHYLVWLIIDKITKQSLGVLALVTDKQQAVLESADYVEAGMMLLPPYQNKGYGQEALGDLIQQYHQRNFSNKIIVRTASDNVKFKQVALNLGFIENFRYDNNLERIEYFLLKS